MIKPTNTNLAEFYRLTRQTIATYKKKNKNLYEAMLNYFIKMNKDGQDEQ